MLLTEYWIDEFINSNVNLAISIRSTEKEKYEYAAQAGKLERPVLYLNSYNLDMNEEDSAKGGACLFSKCLIKNEITSGKEDVLIVEI